MKWAPRKHPGATHAVLSDFCTQPAFELAACNSTSVVERMARSCSSRLGLDVPPRGEPGSLRAVLLKTLGKHAGLGRSCQALHEGGGGPNGGIDLMLRKDRRSSSP